MNFSVASALDAYIAATEKDRPHDGMWHPSTVSGCARKAIYAMRQTEITDPVNDRQKRNFYVGKVWHSNFQAAIAAVPELDVYTEVRILIPDFNTTGDGDQVVIFPDGSAELEEFKSIGDWPFKKLEEPKADHLKQVRPYMIGLRLFGGVDENGRVLPPLGDRLNRVRFTYIGKERLDLKEYVVEYDPVWEDEYRDLIAELNSYMADPNSLPPRLKPEGKGKVHWMCDWGWGRCEFYTRCYGDPDEVAPEF